MPGQTKRTDDLSLFHHPITELFPRVENDGQEKRYRLTKEQIEFFHTNGYLAGVRLLDNKQIETLRAELAQLINPNHSGRELFYEYHTNESSDPANILFHALGAWRVAPGFHDLLWHPAFFVPAAQLLGGAVALHDQIFSKPGTTLMSHAPGLFYWTAASAATPLRFDWAGRLNP